MIPGRDGRRRRLTWGGALTLAACAAVVTLAVVRWEDVADALAALADVDPRWAAVAVAANVASSTVRGLAWAVIVRSAVRPAPAAGWTVSAFLVGQLGNLVAPARLGEAAKVVLLARHVPVPSAVAPVTGSVLAHRLLDVIPLTLLALVLLATAGVPGWVGPVLAVALVSGAALLATAVLLARREGSLPPGAGRLARWLDEARTGLGALRSPAAGAAALTLQSAGWALEVAGAAAAFRALGIETGATEAVLIVLATSVASSVPLWPGNVGVVQVAVTAALVPTGVPARLAIAYGLVLQAVEVVAAVVPGLGCLAAEGVGPGALGRAGRPPLRRDGRGAMS